MTMTTREDTRDALAVTLGELEGLLVQARTGVVVVPDGLIGTVQRLRADMTSALGPRDAGDLAWMLGEILRRLERLEGMTLGGRWRALVSRARRWWARVAGVAVRSPRHRG